MVGFEVAGSVEFEGEAVGLTELVFAVDGTGPVLLLSVDSEVDVAVVVAVAVDGTVDEVVGYAVGTVRHVLEAEAEIDRSFIRSGNPHAFEAHSVEQSLMKSRLFIQHMQIWSRKPWQPVCGTHSSRQGHYV